MQSWVGMLQTLYHHNRDHQPGRPGRIIPVLSPIILLFDSPEISHYSHHLVPIILDYFSLFKDSGGQRRTLNSDFTPPSTEIHILVIVLSVSESLFSSSLSSLSLSGATQLLELSAMV